jgi:DNA polymerase/3'-5' exonuclease PolX
MKFAPYKGVVKIQAGNTANPSCEEIIASETEEDIYKALGLDFLAPTNREALL